jgi:hypothetical protein
LILAPEHKYPHITIDRTMILLAFVFAAAWSVTGAMGAHLPRILEANGATSLQAVAAGAFIGPAQVFARIVEARFLSRYHPLISTRLACLTHPIGVAVLMTAGGGASIRQRHSDHREGHLPLAIFGPENYGYRFGLLGAPSRMAQAAAPLAFSFLIDVMGGRVLIISSEIKFFGVVCVVPA